MNLKVLTFHAAVERGRGGGGEGMNVGGFRLLQQLNFFKWEDTIKSITQVYLQQIRIKKNTSNYKKQAKQSHAYYYQ